MSIPDSHFHKEDRISEKDIIPDDTVLESLPSSALEGARAVVDDGSIKFYRYIKGIWREIGSAAASVFMGISTNFENATRFVISVSGGSSTVTNAGGMLVATNGGAGNTAQCVWNITAQTAIDLTKLSPVITMLVDINNVAAASGEGDFYCGLGEPTVGAVGITFTDHHIGFKILKRSGVLTLYATQADGSTESAQSLDTTVEGNVILLRLELTDSEARYSFLQNPVDDNSWSAPVSLASNLSTYPFKSFSFASSNRNTAFNYNFLMAHAAVTR